MIVSWLRGNLIIHVVSFSLCFK